MNDNYIAKPQTFRPLDRQELQELLNLDVQAIALDVQRQAQIKYQKEKSSK